MENNGTYYVGDGKYVHEKVNESTIIECPGCKKFLGVITINGFMIGDMVMSDFQGKCSCNEQSLIYYRDTLTIENC